MGSGEHALDPDRLRRGRAVAALVRLGWNPPPTTGEQAERILDDIARIGKHGARIQGLTPREQEVLMLVADGHTGPEIARALGVSRETIRTFEKNLRAKLGARTLAHAVAISLRQAPDRS